MQSPLPLTRDIVLVGGGHAHALALRMWGMAPLPGARLTLISPEPAAAYSGMLPGHIAGHYAREALDIDLVRLARFAGARLIFARATGIDRAARRVLVTGRGPVAYDILSIDIGITTAMPGLPGFAEHGVAAKPLGAYADAWAAFLGGLAPASGVAMAVIGGGVAGVELAMASAHRLRALGHRPAITVIERAGQPLPGVLPSTRGLLLRELAAAGITLLTSAAPASVSADEVTLDDGRRIPSALTLGVAGSRVDGWLAETGLALTEGAVRVGPTLQSETDPAIFAAGDCAWLSHAPRSRAGVFAVREAPVLAGNLRALASGGALRVFHPQKDYLKLISTGGKSAAMDRFGMALHGRWIWRWKDRIDRRFMEKFASYPVMAAPALPTPRAAGVDAELQGGKPLCGGCGAKMGRAGLTAALAALPPLTRPDLLTGPGEDAAVIDFGAARQVMTTDHIRAFTEDPWLMARITAIHAMGDVWAMGAAPQAALVQVTLPRMSAALQTRTLTEIMEAAGTAFAEAGAGIVGGHTSIGAELVVGYTVTGIEGARHIGQAGARPGDALILTKPLGTGTILAAEMAGAAPGRVVQGAFASMLRTQGSAAAILAPHAGAMTDITGFGLAGHLAGILQASDCAARLDLAAIPVLPGAEALAAAGHRSTLFPENRALPMAQELPEGPRTDLLFDPQTAGGLLAAVPAGAAAEVIAALRTAGEPAAVIGYCVDGPPAITA